MVVMTRATLISGAVAVMVAAETLAAGAESSASQARRAPNVVVILLDDARKQDVEPDHVIAVHDEIDLPFGALRVKVGGSTAGHNGLRSLQQALRTPDFFRIRLGVGRPTGRRQAADWVLDTFAKREEPEVAILVDEAADAVGSLIADGLLATQDRYNRSAPRET